MKPTKSIHLISIMASYTLFVGVLHAQTEKDKPQTEETKTAPAGPGRENPAADPRDQSESVTRTDGAGDEASVRVAEHRRASQIIGMNIQNAQDEKVGAVDDLVFDLSARRVTAVVISSGGFLGIANELSIVPPSALKLDTEGDAFSANFTKEQLTNAPRFQGSKYPDLNDPKYVLDLYKAYDAEPYLENLDKAETAEGKVRRMVRASELLGMEVKNHQGDSIGDINEIILNATIERISSFVVSSGGFLGIGNTLSVLPAEAVTTTRDAVLVNATKETLAQSPRFTADSWPDTINDPSYLVDIYAPYQFRGDTKSDVEINANAGTGRKDDDTSRKATAADPVTAEDQSNNRGDVALTANIRRRLVTHDTLSFSAKNIRVITVDGKVTLAGQVSSDEELAAILKIAGEEAGPDMVTNRITVEN